MNIRTIVVDDQKSDLERIKQFLSSDNEIECEYFTNFCEKQLDNIVDLYILDIEMPNMNGFELADKIKMINPKAMIIFISQHEQFVFDSLKIDPIYFVRKNTLVHDLKFAINKVKKIYDKHNQIYLFTFDNNILPIRFKDILYFEVLKNTLLLHLVNNKVLTQRKTLKAVQAQVDDYLFCHCHKSYYVNMNAVSQMNATGFILKNNEKIPISRYRRNQVRSDYLRFIKEQ